jgi:hypothetical protein
VCVGGCGKEGRVGVGGEFGARSIGIASICFENKDVPMLVKSKNEDALGQKTVGM